MLRRCTCIPWAWQCTLYENAPLTLLAAPVGSHRSRPPLPTSPAASTGGQPSPLMLSVASVGGCQPLVSARHPPPTTTDSTGGICRSAQLTAAALTLPPHPPSCRGYASFMVKHMALRPNTAGKESLSWGQQQSSHGLHLISIASAARITISSRHLQQLLWRVWAWDIWTLRLLVLSQKLWKLWQEAAWAKSRAGLPSTWGDPWPWSGLQGALQSGSSLQGHISLTPLL